MARRALLFLCLARAWEAAVSTVILGLERRAGALEGRRACTWRGGRASSSFSLNFDLPSCWGREAVRREAGKEFLAGEVVTAGERCNSWEEELTAGEQYFESGEGWWRNGAGESSWQYGS